MAFFDSLTELTPVPPDVGSEPPTVKDLPEVAALEAEGWVAIDPSGALSFLPAIWPQAHRGWVLDRTPRVDFSRDAEGALYVAPRPAAEQEMLREYDALRATDCGLPEPPPDRVWLLRSPWLDFGIPLIIELLAAHGSEEGPVLGQSSSGPEAILAGADLLEWTEDEVWNWWPDDRKKALLRRWRDEGLDAESAASLVLAELSPSDLERLRVPITDGGAALDVEQARAWRHATNASVEEIVAWRRLGAPVEVDLVASVVQRFTSSAAASWMGWGFSFEDFRLLHNVSPDRVLVWREAGFTPVQVHELLGADHQLTPDEVLAFADDGVLGQERWDWLAHGFPASEAAGFRAADVNVQEARVWRSIGADAAAARQQRSRGGSRLPEGLEVGWTAPPGSSERARHYSVDDPPGTRGARTRHRRSR